ncbi:MULTISPECIES: hypothetical protein [Nostocales]|uniref:LysM domain-containing protein n=3 Tax=Nostocales TaxID=1161 RepID=A0A0C1RKY5_9CYAN
MYKKLMTVTTAFVTLSATALSLLNAPAYANKASVYLRQCTAYDDIGEFVMPLDEGYYPRVKGGRFRDGDGFLEVVTPDPEDPDIRIIVHVPNNCLANLSCTYNTSLYIVRRGDSLSEMARQILGNSNRWRDIRKLDGTRFTKDEAQYLEPGERVCIPNLDDVSEN